MQGGTNKGFRFGPFPNSPLHNAPSVPSPRVYSYYYATPVPVPILFVLFWYSLDALWSPFLCSVTFKKFFFQNPGITKVICLVPQQNCGLQNCANYPLEVFDWLQRWFCHLILSAKGSIKVSNVVVVSSCFSHEWTCV